MGNFFFYIQHSFQDEKMIPSGWMWFTANGTSTVTSDVELILKKKHPPAKSGRFIFFNSKMIKSQTFNQTRLLIHFKHKD